jgi:pimeloyl-[acyl-carrier protein] methyl ester esterase
MSLSIERRGHGATALVLIHGWAMHGGVFASLVEALQAQATIYLVDLPGHGHARDSALALEPAACAQAIAAATPPAVWLGWSLGGLVALQGALDHPAKVRALAMLCATPKFTRDGSWAHGNDANVVRQLATDLDDDYHLTLERFLALEAMGSDDPRGELRRLRQLVFARGEPDPRVLHEGLRLLEHTDLRAQLPHLTQPSLWLAGRRDRLVHPEAMRWSAAQAGGSFAQIEHAGHAPFFGHVDAVVAALAPLLAATAQPPVE